jgi:hypothetical protein
VPDSALGLSRQPASSMPLWLDPTWPMRAGRTLECLRPHVSERVFRYSARDRRLRAPVALSRRHALAGARVLNLGSGRSLLDLALRSSGSREEITAIDCDPRVAARTGRVHHLFHDPRDVRRAIAPHFDLIASGPWLDSHRWYYHMLKAIPAYTLGLSVNRYFVLARRAERTR